MNVSKTPAITLVVSIFRTFLSGFKTQCAYKLRDESLDNWQAGGGLGPFKG